MRHRWIEWRSGAGPRVAAMALVGLVGCGTAPALAAPTPEPGKWRSVAQLKGRISITQEHTGTLTRDACSGDLVYQVPGKPALRLSRAENGDYVGTSDNGGCTTRWRLEPGAQRMEGGYRGSCGGQSLTADVMMTRTAPLPDTAGDSPARSTPGREVPDDWLPGLDETGAIDHATAVEAVEDVMGARASGGSGEAFSGYAWPDVERGSTHVSMWLTADKRPRLHESLRDRDGCAEGPGDNASTRYMLNFKLYRPVTEHMVFVQLIEADTGRIVRQREGGGGPGESGLREAIREAYGKLRVTVPLPR